MGGKLGSENPIVDPHVTGLDVAEAVGVSTGNNLQQQQQLYYDSHIYK